MGNTSKQSRPACILVIGTNDTGKTYFTYQVAKVVSKKRPVFFVSEQGAKSEEYAIHDAITLHDKKAVEAIRTGIYNVYAIQHEKTQIIESKRKGKPNKKMKLTVFDYILKNVKNALVIFDDIEDYTSPNFANSGGYKKLIAIQRKNLGLDIFILFHGFELVQNRLWNNINAVQVFKTSIDEMRAIEKFFPNKEKFRAVVARVNRRAGQTVNGIKYDFWYNETIILKKF